MSDGSVSWDQPASRGFAGWEGYCGQTAVANLISAYGGQCVSPTSVSRITSDPGPGSLPSTLLHALERLQPGVFKCTVGEALGNPTPRRPVATLLRWDGKIFHWVTVVRTNSARVIFNHWGKQQSLTTQEFNRRWSFGELYGLAYLVGRVSPRTSLRQK